jgi:hypothetical protein
MIPLCCLALYWCVVKCGFVEFCMSLKKKYKSGNLQKKLVQNAEFFDHLEISLP